MVKSGLILFVLIYICIFLLTAKSVADFNTIPVGEKRVLAVVVFALPLLAVRILWSLLAYFSHTSTFSIVGTSSGDVVVRAMMAILEEFLIVIAYTIVGLMVPPAYAAQFDVESKSVGTQQPTNPHRTNGADGRPYAPNLPAYAPQEPTQTHGRQ